MIAPSGWRSARRTRRYTTTPSPTSVTLGTTAVTLKDSATLSGGYHETGTVTFTLYRGSTLVDTESAAVSGNGTYATPTGYTLPTTGTVTGTYQWDASYNGDTNNNAACDINDCAERVAVVAGGGSISGTKYNDLTGNGFSPDDTGQSGVTIDLYKESNGCSGLQTGSGGDTLVATTTTGEQRQPTASATWLPGTYYVQEVVPSGVYPDGRWTERRRRGNATTPSVSRAARLIPATTSTTILVPTCTPTNVSLTSTTTAARR